jgi:hypothetical protein
MRFNEAVEPESAQMRRRFGPFRENIVRFRDGQPPIDVIDKKPGY